MKKIFTATLALAVMAIFLSACAVVINVDEATMKDDKVLISGNQAPKGTAIEWEGVLVGTNTKADGAFTFNTTNRPTNCVGRLKIGTEARDVVINNCTPAKITVIEPGLPRKRHLPDNCFQGTHNC